MGPDDGSEYSQQAGILLGNKDVSANDVGTIVFNANPEVRDRGQIAEMTLPHSWVEAPPRQFSGSLGMRSLRVIYPREVPSVHLEFYYRGLPMSEATGANFLRVLEAPPHSLDAEEWNSLSDLVWDRNDPNDFELFSARTEDWNGRRILLVEGRYIQIQEDNFEIFVDAVGDGRTVQEIIFQAPVDLYIQYLRAVEDSMKSIRWTQK